MYPLVERLTVVALLGMKRPSGQAGRVRPFESPGGQRVLVVAAHPDDETIGCFATILSHLECGDSVRVLVVTDGSGSRAGGLGPGEMARARSLEIKEVSKLMPGIHLVQLGLVEGHWEAGELATVLEQQLTQFAPDLVYAPSCVDFHPEHLKVARAIASALGMCATRAAGQLRSVEAPLAAPHARVVAQKGAAPSAPTVRAYEMQVPLSLELANRYTPLGRHYQAKARAIAAYRSQRGALDLWRREARYLGALLDTPGGAEAFWELPACAYRRVIARGNWDWRTMPFKSLSGRPLGDLTAYLKGRNARLTLRALAEAEGAA